MKKLEEFVNEKLKISNNTPNYTHFPETREELIEIIREMIKEKGPDCDLNCIDVSRIDNFGAVFASYGTKLFNGNISKWDMSNAKSLNSMFNGSMFSGVDGGIADWDVSNVEMMDYMFNGSKFNSDISGWNVEKVRSMVCAFQDCPFDQDITKWNPKSIEHRGFTNTFEYCPLKAKKKLPKWYKARF